MKISKIEVLLDKRNEAQSDEFEIILEEIKAAISKVVWPLTSDNFSIRPVEKGNGVKPIKNGCMDYLAKQGWELEKRLKVVTDLRPGPIDSVKQLSDGRAFAVEWETGNISSSHRAINKMVLGMLEGSLAGGVLILPSRNLYRYLTDRIGNFKEISPYFDVWRNVTVDNGYLAVIEIEHEGEADDVDLIPKGTDGWAQYNKNS